MRTRPARRARVAFALVAVAAAAYAYATSPAWAWWSDSGSVAGGAVTTWGLTGVQCPVPASGSDHVLSWSTLAGSSYTVTITVDPDPSGFSSWSVGSTVREGQPLTTTGSQARWGISTLNPVELTNFVGTWQLTATAPGGIWTATRTGTWAINYATRTNACAVNP